MLNRSVPQDFLLLHDVDAGRFTLSDSETNAIFDDIKYLHEITIFNCFDG